MTTDPPVYVNDYEESHADPDAWLAAQSHAEAFQRTWSSQPTLLLCDRMARKGLAVVAQDGECPVHSGDGCLYTYVQVVGVREALLHAD